MPQTLFLVVGGGITEQAGDHIARVLGLPNARVATDEEVLEHLTAQGKHQASVAATEAVQAPAPAEATPAPAESVPEASSAAPAAEN